MERPAGEERPSVVEAIRREGQLARQLRDADEVGRRSLYSTVYDELYSMHLQERGPRPIDQTFGAHPVFLPHLLRVSRPGDRVLEVGCGCGYLSIELARQGRHVVGVDVSQVAVKVAQQHGRSMAGTPPHFRVISGTTLPYPDASFDLVFSVEVLEHLHPDDVPSHLREIFRVLRPGGRHWVLTPNGLASVSVWQRFGIEGSHDEAAGDVHLKEWTYGELVPLFRWIGFDRLRSPWSMRRGGALPPLPARWKVWAEPLVRLVPGALAKTTAMLLAGTGACVLIAEKPRARR